MRLVVSRALVAIAAPFLALAAQEPAPLRQPDVVPVDLAAALAAAGGFGGAPQIQVGTIPALAASRIYVPPAARVLGSASFGTTVVAVLGMPASSDSVLLDYRAELERRGWKSPTMPNYGGGFRSAPATSPSGIPTRTILCKEQEMLVASAARRRGVSTDITVRLSPEGSGACHLRPEIQQVASSSALERAELPTLINPPGAVNAGFGFEGCPRPRLMSPSSFADLRVSMTAEALLEHYARQMRDSGWTANPPEVPVVTRSFTKADSTGARIEVTLMVDTAPRDPACHEVNMTLTRGKQP